MKSNLQHWSFSASHFLAPTVGGGFPGKGGMIFGEGMLVEGVLGLLGEGVLGEGVLRRMTLGGGTLGGGILGSVMF